MVSIANIFIFFSLGWFSINQECNTGVLLFLKFLKRTFSHYYFYAWKIQKCVIKYKNPNFSNGKCFVIVRNQTPWMISINDPIISFSNKAGPCEGSFFWRKVGGVGINLTPPPPPQPLSYFKKNLSNIIITLYNCSTIYLSESVSLKNESVKMLTSWVSL